MNKHINTPRDSLAIDGPHDGSAAPPDKTLTRTRIAISDREHAGQIANLLQLGNLLQGGGTASGFGDWLFVNRSTFNGANPLQQPRVYVNAYRHASTRGVNFDALCRQRADEKEQTLQKARAAFEGRLADIKGLFEERPRGLEVIRAIAELSLGRGLRFAEAFDGKPLQLPPARTLKSLLQLLERFGGADSELDKYDWQREQSEENFRWWVSATEKYLRDVRSEDFDAPGASESIFLCIAQCAACLSSLSRVRTMLRPLLMQADMLEKIPATESIATDTRAARAHRKRAL